MKVTITYTGEAGTNVWGGVDRLPQIVFEKNKAVEIDTSKVPANHKGFYEHVIEKARGNHFFTVEETRKAETTAKTAEKTVKKRTGKSD